MGKQSTGLELRMVRLLYAFLLAIRVASAAVGPPIVPEVTVTAPKPPEPQQLAGKSVPNFVKNHGKAAILSGQLGRWVTEICPRTEGLAPAFNGFVSARVEAIAASVGAPHQWAAQCRPNVAVYFTADPQAMLDEVAKHAPQLLGFHYPHQAKRLATVDRPIQAWYVTAIRGSTGQDIIDDIWGTLPPGRLGSRLTVGRSSLIVFALIVADARKLTNYSVGSISDYIALLTLSRPASLDGCGQLPSVIDLLSPVCGSESTATALTAGDTAYLRALYSLNMEQPLSLQRMDIQDKMMREFQTSAIE
jgi:hypothetical protein